MAFKWKFLTERLMQKTRRNPGKTLAKSWHLKKAKQLTFTLGLKQVMRFLEGYENDDDDKGEKW